MGQGGSLVAELCKQETCHGAPKALCRCYSWSTWQVSAVSGMIAAFLFDVLEMCCRKEAAAESHNSPLPWNVLGRLRLATVAV